ncbi:MAG: 2-amino-4-hydroxy-6-hydroxymethyldihydropteridine diphosphokinase, partial [Limosilactobacillus reuteri]|nr:2-amino-4-hydroxy-6-hydroxymethyldihydropteridine diphosphokinase [Limosilactobacillus reuteri]
IDLDIIDFGHQRIKTSTLTIPHPEMVNRQFVLLPMREITNQKDPYYQQLDHLLNETPDHNWLKKIYGREVFSWTNKK